MRAGDCRQLGAFAQPAAMSPNGAESSFRCSSFPRPKLLVPTLCVGTRGADALRRAYPARVVRWVLLHAGGPGRRASDGGVKDAERRNEGEEGEHEEMARHVPNGAELSFRCSSFPRPKLLVPTLCVGTRGADALRRAYPARVVRWVLPQRRRPRTQSVRCGRYDAERRNEGTRGWLVVTRSGGRASTQPRLSSKA